MRRQLIIRIRRTTEGTEDKHERNNDEQHEKMGDN